MSGIVVWVKMRANEEQIANSSYRPTEKEYLRVSKSSLMTYMMCPRQFYWRYVADIPSPPPSEAALRGGRIHKVMEVGLLEGSDRMQITAEEEGVADDIGVDSLNMLLHQIAHDIGGLVLVEAEVKHQVAENYNGKKIIWVGMIDGVIRHPDGGLILMELKTGKMNMGKLARTRKELVYYSRLLSTLGYDSPITHFMYISPDYEIPDDGSDKLLLEGNKRGKTLWLGAERGIAIMEKINKRSINAFTESLSSTIDSLTIQQYPMNWNDYFCPLWCEFNMNCESELTGFVDDGLGEWI